MPPLVPLQDLWVLLVEDEPVVAELLTLVLEEAGVKVITASSGSEALKALDAFVPNLFISDIHSKDTDGWSLLARVRALEAEWGMHRVPAIAVTGDDVSLLGLECKDQGRAVEFQRYLLKPVEIQDFIDVVAELGCSHKF